MGSGSYGPPPDGLEAAYNKQAQQAHGVAPVGHIHDDEDSFEESLDAFKREFRDKGRSSPCARAAYFCQMIISVVVVTCVAWTASDVVCNHA